MISENWDGEGRVLERIWEGESERERWDWREESLEMDTVRLRFVEQHVGVVGERGREGALENVELGKLAVVLVLWKWGEKQTS